MKPTEEKNPTTATGQWREQEQKLARLRRRYEQLEQQLTELEQRLPELPGSDVPPRPNKPR